MTVRGRGKEQKRVFHKNKAMADKDLAKEQMEHSADVPFGKAEVNNLENWVNDPSKWIDDYVNDTCSPVDEPGVIFATWWRDMSPNETRNLFKRAYIAGMERGLKACR